jgi:hypothetical protein
MSIIRYLLEWERPKVQEADDLKTLSTEMGFKEHLGFGADEPFISTREHSGTFHFRKNLWIHLPCVNLHQEM